MGIDGAINSLNQFTYTMGTVQGAAEAMVPAVHAVNGAVNQIAGVFTGDTYQPNPYQPGPVVMPLNGGPKAGIVGSLIAGGITGAVMHQSTADALRSFKTDGFGTGLKNLGASSLKSGLIGAGVMGVVSGIKNFAASSRGEITSAQAKGNVAADTIGGILAGTGAGLSSGLASMVLAKMVPGGGIITTIGAAAAGALGATGVNFAYDGSGLRDQIANGIAGTPTQNYGYPQQYSGYNSYGY